MGYSVDAKTGIINETLRNTAFSGVGAAFSTPAVQGGANVLVSGSGIRQAATFSAPTAAVPSVTDLSSQIVFPAYNSGTWSPTTPNLFRLYSASSGGILIAEDDATQALPLSANSVLRHDTMPISLNVTSGVATAAYLQSIHSRLLRAGAAVPYLRYIGVALNGTEHSGGTYARGDLDGLWSAPSAVGSSVSSSVTSYELSSSVDWAGAGADYNQYLLSSTPSGAAEVTLTVTLQTIIDGQRLFVSPTYTID